MEEKDRFKELEREKARKGGQQLEYRKGLSEQKTIYLHLFFSSSLPESTPEKFPNLVAFYSTPEMKEYYFAY